MRGLSYVLFLVLGTGLMVACDRDEESGGFATAPSLASTQGQCSNFNSLVQAAFTVNASRQIVQGYAQNMTQAFGSNKKGKATWYGFQILAAIDTAGRLQGTLEANSNLAIATFPCMSLGTATLPTSLTTELGTTGAFGVRGRPATDNEAVVAHDGIWIIEPPAGKAWQDITTLQTRTGITGDTAKLFLVLGKPGSGTGFNAQGDVLLAGSFDWSTIPTATFGNPYVVVGNCSVANGFLQHFPAGNPNAEIFGFVEPVQCPGSARARARASDLGGAAVPGNQSDACLRHRVAREDRRRFQARPQPVRDHQSGQGEPEHVQPVAEQEGHVKNKPFTPTPVINRRATAGYRSSSPRCLVYLTADRQQRDTRPDLLQLGLQ